MAGQTSALIQIAVSPEAVPGTYLQPVANEYLPKAEGVSFNDAKEMVALKAAKGNISTTEERRISKLMGTGSIPTPFGSKTAGNMLAAIFGQYDASPTDNGGGSYTHDYTVNNTNTPTSFSIVRIDGLGGQKHFTYGLLNTGSFTATANGDPIILETEWMSRASEAQSDVTPAYFSDEVFFYPDHLTLEIINEDGSFTGTTVGVDEFSLTVDHAVDARGITGQAGVDSVYWTDFIVTGSVVIVKEDNVAFNEALTNQNKAIRVTITDGGANTVTFTMSSLTFENPEVTTDNHGIEQLTRGFEVHNPVDNFSASLTNEVAAYPLT